MSRLATALTALALIGCTLLSIATSPALASRPSGHGYTQHGRFCAGGTAARPNPRLYACNDGGLTPISGIGAATTTTTRTTITTWGTARTRVAREPSLSSGS